jgi:hypothetical protein
MTTSSPSRGFTANWMLQPPASTPISRMMATAASRITWYSRSVSVMAGATVMESPVWTPIGSKFSMEQTMTTLSAQSRMTSSSNSFHPTSDRSTSTEWTGERSSPRSTMASNSAGSCAMPPPVPPSVNEGRMIAGNPVPATASRASASDVTVRPSGQRSPIFRMASANSLRSSATRMARALAPMSSTPYCASTPRSCSASATLSAVCPPMVGSTASGRSRAMTFSTNSGVTGST